MGRLFHFSDIHFGRENKAAVAAALEHAHANPRDLVLIEWPDRAGALLPAPRWEVEIEDVGDPGRRRVEARPVGRPPPLPPPDGRAP